MDDNELIELCERLQKLLSDVDAMLQQSRENNRQLIELLTGLIAQASAPHEPSAAV